MENVNQIIKNVLDSFFEVGEQDKIIHISLEDSQLVANAIEDALKNKKLLN